MSTSSRLESDISESHILLQALLELSHPLPSLNIDRLERVPESGTQRKADSLIKTDTNKPDRPAAKKKSNNIVAEVIREVTAYNVGDPKQNYGNPCISANGENICAALAKGLRRCAANFVPFGTKLHIEGFGHCTVTDRMNKRYKNRVDIAMKLTEKAKALKFGLRKLKVQILKVN